MDKKNHGQLIRGAYYCWEYESASDSLWLYFDLCYFYFGRFARGARKNHIGLRGTSGLGTGRDV